MVWPTVHHAPGSPPARAASGARRCPRDRRGCQPENRPPRPGTRPSLCWVASRRGLRGGRRHRRCPASADDLGQLLGPHLLDHFLAATILPDARWSRLDDVRFSVKQHGSSGFRCSIRSGHQPDAAASISKKTSVMSYSASAEMISPAAQLFRGAVLPPRPIITSTVEAALPISAQPRTFLFPSLGSRSFGMRS